MQTDSQDVDSALEVVRLARDRTVAARTARIYFSRSLFTTGQTESTRYVALGVADLVLKRTHNVEQDRRFEPPPPVPARFLVFMGPVALVLWLVSRLIPPFRKGLEELNELFRRFWMPKERVCDGGVSYTRVEGGRAWATVTTDRPKNNLFLWMLDLLPYATDDLLVLSPRQVRGEPCNHYRVVVRVEADDPDAIMAVFDDKTALRLRSGLPIEAWLDSEGRARRVSLSSDPREEGRWIPAGSWTRQTIDLWDFGVDAEIEVPAPEEIVAWGEAENWDEGAAPPSPFDPDVVFP